MRSQPTRKTSSAPRAERRRVRVANPPQRRIHPRPTSSAHTHSSWRDGHTQPKPASTKSPPTEGTRPQRTGTSPTVQWSDTTLTHRPPPRRPQALNAPRRFVLLAGADNQGQEFSTYVIPATVSSGNTQRQTHLDPKAPQTHPLSQRKHINTPDCDWNDAILTHRPPLGRSQALSRAEREGNVWIWLAEGLNPAGRVPARGRPGAGGPMVCREKAALDGSWGRSARSGIEARARAVRDGSVGGVRACGYSHLWWALRGRCPLVFCDLGAEGREAA